MFLEVTDKVRVREFRNGVETIQDGIVVSAVLHERGRVRIRLDNGDQISTFQHDRSVQKAEPPSEASAYRKAQQYGGNC